MKLKRKEKLVAGKQTQKFEEIFSFCNMMDL